MPSKAYLEYLELLEDVNALNLTHSTLSGGTAGRKKLGFLTRSAIVMLCAAWERYNENLLLESIEIILSTDPAAKDLPLEVKKYISEKVREEKHEIYPIELAGEGWKNLWKGYASNETELLHTPNPEKLRALFKRYLGIPDYTRLWLHGDSLKIEKLVKVRGSIAHNGSKAKYVRINDLRSYLSLVTSNVIEIDYQMSQYLKSTYAANTWIETYYTSLATTLPTRIRNRIRKWTIEE
ncbi:MAG: hypothetical protein DSY83_01535 [Flavobacteriia bacterium]|nr:MAG: hypothetical protein DSY83_01535 [Flavobacteriia bacterium]